MHSLEQQITSLKQGDETVWDLNVVLPSLSSSLRLLQSHVSITDIRLNGAFRFLNEANRIMWPAFDTALSR